MKRSEMLDHIKEDLLEKLKHRWLERGETDKWVEFTANELLDMIEGFGMLPPESSRSRRTTMFDLQHAQYAYIWDEDDFFEEQESEDEEK